MRLKEKRKKIVEYVFQEKLETYKKKVVFMLQCCDTLKMFGRANQ